VTDTTCQDQDGCFVSGVCDGTAACEDYSDQATCDANGCDWLLPCQPAVDCGAQMTSTVCNLQTGCEWDIVDDVCIVKQTNGCVDELVAGDCGMLVGCLWNAAYFSCGGTATECSAIDVADCVDQEGCTVQ
jgi:hypothetical protein